MYLLEKDRIGIFNTFKNKREVGVILVPGTNFGDTPDVNAAVTPDGQYLYAPIGESVYLIDVLNKVYVNSFTAGEFETQVAIAPNNNFAYFPDSISDGIVVVDISPQ